MPELGESVTEGTVTRWLKQVGDSVEVDEPLLEVSTDKVDTEIPSPVAGTLLEITAGEDETVDVGGQLAVIGDASAAPSGGTPSGTSPADSAPADAPIEEAPAAEREQAAEEPSNNGKVAAQAVEQTEREERPAEQPERAEGGDGERGAPYVTPLVRKLAAEHDVDLSTISGSGVGGRIRKQDVLAAAEARKPAPEPEPAPAAAAPAASAPAAAPPRQMPKPSPDGPKPGTTVKMPRLRQVIAQRMTESLRVSAQLTTVQEVDVTHIARLRARAKAEFERREGVKLTFLPFFAKATVEALKAFPQVNASINEETKEVTYHGAVHLAIAVDTPRGLLVPVIKNAEDLNLAGLARRIADVAERTRANKIGPDELSGGTFTITNIGSAGALFDTPIINQPQVAILGTGKITKQPAVVTGPDGEDSIAIRSVCYLPLTYDHRLVDGADAGRFVSAIKARLEEGAFEADLGL
jgi:2-oxoglutarate dehydrogenase E2 component (dihydrolipoamide succinyltransferase)